MGAFDVGMIPYKNGKYNKKVKIFSGGRRECGQDEPAAARLWRAGRINRMGFYLREWLAHGERGRGWGLYWKLLRDRNMGFVMGVGSG